MHRSVCKNSFIFGLLFSPLAWSQASSLDAHVHGEAELTIAFEGQRIEMQLVSPAANIFGFEHAPKNDEQNEQVHRAETILKSADTLFQFSGSDCKNTSQALEIPFSHEEASHEEHDHDEEHANEEHGHDEEHANEEHGHDEKHSDEEHGHNDEVAEAHDDDSDDHGHDDHEHEEDHETHTQVVANYVFECDSAGLTQIQASFLEQFPAIESLDAQWITETKQGAAELSANQAWIDLR